MSPRWPVSFHSRTKDLGRSSFHGFLERNARRAPRSFAPLESHRLALILAYKHAPAGSPSMDRFFSRHVSIKPVLFKLRRIDDDNTKTDERYYEPCIRIHIFTNNSRRGAERRFRASSRAFFLNLRAHSHRIANRATSTERNRDARAKIVFQTRISPTAP